MVEDIFEGIFKLIFRVIAYVFVEIVVNIVVEVLIRGVGYVICFPFKPDIDSDSGWVVLVGALFWVILFALIYVVFFRL